MPEVKAEHLQKGQVILMSHREEWATISKPPTLGRQFVIVTTEFGETGLRFGVMVQVQVQE